MSGHMSEHLIWAPDARDDLAFTMYAFDQEHSNAFGDLKNRVLEGEFNYFSSFDEFQEQCLAFEPAYGILSSKDWNYLYSLTMEW